MSTEFFAMQPPPGKSALANYVRGKPHDEQPDAVPANFLEAMAVREDVFVHEQKVPMENELDADDERSWHWVTFVSIGASSAAAASSSGAGTGTGSRPQKRGSTAGRKAAATIRLVPPPHPPHPNAASQAADAGTHTEEEPYVKLGRLSTLKPYRGLGLARMLLDNVLRWASEHPEDILPPASATDREAARLEASEEDREAMSREWARERWQGLILVHAQTSVEKWWEKAGFKRDETMGEWDEEGIMHVGMWRRIPVKERRPSLPSCASAS